MFEKFTINSADHMDIPLKEYPDQQKWFIELLQNMAHIINHKYGAANKFSIILDQYIYPISPTIKFSITTKTYEATETSPIEEFYHALDWSMNNMAHYENKRGATAEYTKRQMGKSNAPIPPFFIEGLDVDLRKDPLLLLYAVSHLAALSEIKNDLYEVPKDIGNLSEKFRKNAAQIPELPHSMKNIDALIKAQSAPNAPSIPKFGIKKPDSLS